MKVLFYIALDYRGKITELFLDGLVKFIAGADKWNIQTSVLFIYSDSKDYMEAIKIFPDAEYIAANNYPIADKLNKGLFYAFQKDWDYLMQLGADDILDPLYWDEVIDFMLSRSDIFGMRQFYMLDLETKRLKLSVVHPLNIGGGRFISRKLLDKVVNCDKVECLQSDTGGNRRGEIKVIHENQVNDSHKVIEEGLKSLWTSGKNSGLDSDSLENIIKRNGKTVFIQHSIERPYLMDIKSDRNINKFDQVDGDIKTFKEIPKYFAYLELI